MIHLTGLLFYMTINQNEKLISSRISVYIDKYKS